MYKVKLGLHLYYFIEVYEKKKENRKQKLYCVNNWLKTIGILNH